MANKEITFKPLSFSVPEEFFEPIKRRCRAKDTDRSKYIRDLIRKDLEKSGVLPSRSKQAA